MSGSFIICTFYTNIKGVQVILAFATDFSTVPGHDAFCNGNPQPVTLDHAAGFVNVVKTFENIFPVLRRNGFQGLLTERRYID